MMNKSVLIVCMASRQCAEFKKRVLQVDSSAKFYDALIYKIKCCEEVLAVQVDGNVPELLKIYDLLAEDAEFKLWAVLQPVPERERIDRIACFNIQFKSGDPLDNLLDVWKYCDEAAKKLSRGDRGLLHFVLYVNRDENRIYFKADCPDAVNDAAWQEMIGEFCGHVMKLHFDDIKVSFETGLIKSNH